MLTWYSTILPSSTRTCCSLIRAPRTLRSVFAARFKPIWMASSKLLLDVELISLTFATAMGTSRGNRFRSLSLREEIANLGQQLLFLRGPGRRRGRFFTLHPVHRPDDEEQRESHDEEVHEGIDHHAPAHDDSAGLSGCLERGIGRGAIGTRPQEDVEVREVGASRQHADDRHQDLIDQTADDGRERSTDDDTDRHVDHVAAHTKGFELLQHGMQPPLSPHSALPPGVSASLRPFEPLSL